MSYITNSDIEERLGSDTYVQLTDDDGDAVADVGVVDEARLGSEGEVNSYLARRFQVPIDLTAHPELADVLATVTLDLVEYRLRMRRPPAPDSSVRKRDQTIEWLRRVADGEIELPSTASVSPNTTRGIVAGTSGSERTLSRDEMSDF